jgi:hypothetical protein
LIGESLFTMITSVEVAGTIVAAGAKMRSGNPRSRAPASEPVLAALHDLHVDIEAGGAEVAEVARVFDDGAHVGRDRSGTDGDGVAGCRSRGRGQGSECGGAGEKRGARSRLRLRVRHARPFARR